jgi:hypothetical protein
MIIFPSSPVWADIIRTPMWNEEVFKYDSGQRQGSTAWARPLYRYEVHAKNYTETKHSSLEAFWNTLKGKTTPFLFKDPYDYATSASIVQPTTTAMGNGSGFYLVQQNSWRVIPDSVFLSISDPRSGVLTYSTHYVTSWDTGWVTVKVAVSSLWTSSFQYFRKVAFDDDWSEQSNLWNSFESNLLIQEMIP